MSEPKLLPCPFCGCEAYVSKRLDESLWSHETVWWSQICCRECDASGGQHCDDPEAAEAIAAWNTRAKPEHGEG